jgi:hypothetical protein
MSKLTRRDFTKIATAASVSTALGGGRVKGANDRVRQRTRLMTDPERRKKRSEELLKTQGIPINPSLPTIESEEETHRGMPKTWLKGR